MVYRVVVMFLCGVCCVCLIMCLMVGDIWLLNSLVDLMLVGRFIR